MWWDLERGHAATAASCYQARSALLTHPINLTHSAETVALNLQPALSHVLQSDVILYPHYPDDVVTSPPHVLLGYLEKMCTDDC